MLPQTEPLRIGLLIDDWTVPRWIENILLALNRASYAEVVLVILPVRAPPARESAVRRLWRNRRALAFMAYQRKDARQLVPDDPFARRDVGPLLDRIPSLEVAPIQTQDFDRFPDAAIDEIARHRLDVVLRFGFRVLRGRVLDIARHGIWSFHHGDNHVKRGSPAGTWEVLEDQPVTGAMLQVLTENIDDYRVIGRVNIATLPGSVRRNRCALYERTWPMMPRLLEQLHANGHLRVEPAPLAYDRRLHGPPDNPQVLRGVARLASRFVRSRIDRTVSVDQWQLGYHVGEGSPAAYRFKAIEPPPDRYWADPFPVEAAGGYVVFFEEFLYPRRGERKPGWISCMRIDRTGALGPVTKVLEEPHHLSYPLVFSWHGDWYMLPESSRAKRVTLYRCKQFPDAWEPCAVLLEDCPGIDNTLTEIDGRWWLWVTLRLRGTSGADETLLFHADTPLGPFKPHPRNPVATDARNARGAGRVFLHEGSWIRPAQDGTGRYGRAIAFMRIDRLDLNEYVESEVGRIEPLWSRSIVATHTYNRAGCLQMLDFQKRRLRIGLSAHRFILSAEHLFTAPPRP
jgi:hypothetical protein